MARVEPSSRNRLSSRSVASVGLDADARVTEKGREAACRGQRHVAQTPVPRGTTPCRKRAAPPVTTIRSNGERRQQDIGSIRFRRKQIPAPSIQQ